MTISENYTPIGSDENEQPIESQALRVRRVSQIADLQNSIQTAINLGYISTSLTKEKDQTSWSQPKDPLTKKMELFVNTCPNSY